MLTYIIRLNHGLSTPKISPCPGLRGNVLQGAKRFFYGQSGRTSLSLKLCRWYGLFEYLVQYPPDDLRAGGLVAGTGVIGTLLLPGDIEGFIENFA